MTTNSRVKNGKNFIFNFATMPNDLKMTGYAEEKQKKDISWTSNYNITGVCVFVQLWWILRVRVCVYVCLYKLSNSLALHFLSPTPLK